MKKTHLFLFILFIIGIMTFSCSDKEEDIPPFLTVEPKTISLSDAATTKDILIKTNAASWTADVKNDANTWLKTSSNQNLLRIIIAENKGESSRKGEIKITAGNLSETIVVEQMGSAPAILVSSNFYSLPVNGGDILFDITSNIEYDILVPADASWLTPKPQKETRATDMITKKYQYQAAWNPQEVERKTEIIIKHKNGPLEKKISVVQKAQAGYTGTSSGDVKDDIKVPVKRGTASSFQNGEGIEKSFDGDMNTIYHSNWNNVGVQNYFPITLEYFFENQESIDYLVYYPRTEGYNGRFKETEIWVTTESEPTAKKLMDFDFKGSSSATKVIFDKPLVKPKSVKFIVKSGVGDNQGFASCAEMEFYRRNPENTDPLTLFTDITCSQLKPGITLQDIEKVSNNLYRNIALYMLNGTYPREFRIDDYKAWPHPDIWARENKTSTLSLLDNPTGISITEGEEMVIFVGETGSYTLSLKVQNLDKPGGDGYNNASFYPLSKGVNKFTARNNGLAYVFYHTSDYKSAPQVKIHFATGKVNGYYDTKKHQPSDWSRLLNAATDKYFDVLGEHAHLTFPTDQFKTYAATNGAKLIEAYDDLVFMEKDFMGLNKYNRSTVNRAYFHAMYTSYMYSTSYRTAYNISGTDVQKAVLDVNQLKKSPWGPAHEMGHTLQTRPGFLWIGMTEVTNNVHSLYVQTQWGNASRIESENMGRYNNRYEKAYHNSFVNKVTHPGESDVFCKLVSLWQIQLYFANAKGKTDVYKDLYETVRISPNLSTDGARQLEFVKMMCEITQTDLTEFFIKWGYLSPVDMEIDDYGKRRITITQAQIDETIAGIKAKNYPILAEKMEYICDSNWQIFRDKLSVQQGTATKSGTKITMTGWKNVVAYEVYENEKLVFVSNKDSFNLESNVTTNTKVFAVAYNGNKTEVSF